MLVVSVESCLRTELSCSSKNCAANVLDPTGVPSSLNPSVSSTPVVSVDLEDFAFE